MFGFYSYSIYLSHYIAGILYTSIFRYGIIENNFKLKTSAMFCGTLVHIIDVNIDKYKRKTKKKTSLNELEKK